ncbi:hypothetical protein ACFFQW_38375 [Umezawaea endophytica]|uniref:Uncharacterized protein n=1 Tax=Umezawaea endophytica TaxID=1654476 RepID=A0A9X3AJC5_9PSEU|nr:hypothetical protein [Umezawaea endophytica]MCS7483811.1 hypothetical protein [Umezawaea endophytica]
MDLIVLLYELRDGKFTNKDAAQRWAQRNPADCRSSGVLPADSTKNGPVDARRLPELMKMTKGPVPQGLVQAFVDLWAEHHQHDRALIDAKATVLNSLYSAVRQHGTQRQSIKGHSMLSKDIGQFQEKTALGEVVTAALPKQLRHRDDRGPVEEW